MKKSKFMRIRCSGCKNEQVTFGKASSEVKCNKCNAIISKPAGGKPEIRARILETL